MLHLLAVQTADEGKEQCGEGKRVATFAKADVRLNLFYFLSASQQSDDAFLLFFPDDSFKWCNGCRCWLTAAALTAPLDASTKGGWQWPRLAEHRFLSTARCVLIKLIWGIIHLLLLTRRRFFCKKKTLGGAQWAGILDVQREKKNVHDLGDFLFVIYFFFSFFSFIIFPKNFLLKNMWVRYRTTQIERFNILKKKQRLEQVWSVLVLVSVKRCLQWSKSGSLVFYTEIA